MLVCTVWGLNFVVAKVGMHQFPPLLFTGLRFLILTLALMPFLAVAKGRMRQVIAITLFNGAFHFGLISIAIALSAASVVAIVSQLNVPFATVMSIMFLGERVSLRRWSGIAMTVLGVTCVSFDPHVFDTRFGLLCAAAASLSGAIASVLMRRLAGVGVLQLQSWTALVSAPLLLGASFIWENGQLLALDQAHWQNWSALLFTTIGASLIGHNGYFYLLQRYEVSLIAPISLLSPILGVVFGIGLLHETLTPRILFGAVSVFLGIGILVTSGGRVAKPLQRRPEQDTRSPD